MKHLNFCQNLNETLHYVESGRNEYLRILDDTIDTLNKIFKSSNTCIAKPTTQSLLNHYNPFQTNHYLHPALMIHHQRIPHFNPQNIDLYMNKTKGLPNAFN